MFKQFLSVLLVVLVFGCGGGGGGDSSIPDPRAGGVQQPTFTDGQVVPTANAIIAQSDSLIISDLVGKLRGETYLATSSCSKTRCNIYLGGSLIDTVRLQDIKSLGIDPNLTYSAIGEKNGVKIAQGRGRTSAYGLSVNAENYGGWLDHSAFLVERYTVRSGSISGVNVSGLQFGDGISIGDDTGSRPSGNATWGGVMMGATDVNGPTQTLRGDATISYDLRQNSLNVLFTEIYNLNTNSRFQDMQWSNIGVSSTGTFNQYTGNSNIQGRFYGPSHAEVGGVFIHSVAIGAFGAKRN